MPELQGDISYSTNGGETTFSANTPAGEEFLDGPELVAPNQEAQEFIGEAKAAGLTVLPFP
jgi:hypothetical protein